MRKVFLAMLCLAISCTTALGGEFYGTIKEGGKPIKEATKVEVKSAREAIAQRRTNSDPIACLCRSRENAPSRSNRVTSHRR